MMKASTSNYVQPCSRSMPPTGRRLGAQPQLPPVPLRATVQPIATGQFANPPIDAAALRRRRAGELINQKPPLDARDPAGRGPSSASPSAAARLARSIRKRSAQSPPQSARPRETTHAITNPSNITISCTVFKFAVQADVPTWRREPCGGERADQCKMSSWLDQACKKHVQYSAPASPSPAGDGPPMGGVPGAP